MRITNIVTNDYSLKVRIYGKGNRDTMNPAILFLSGWNPSSIGITSSDILAPLCAKKLNCICIVANLRGMGSKGDINSLTHADFLSDVIAIYDFIADYDGIDKTQISVAGESFGGYMACLLSSKRLIENLLLRVPTDFSNEGFSNIPQIKIAVDLSKSWKQKKHLTNESFALEALHNYKGNICLVASEKDEYIPYQTTENYINAVSNKEKLVFHLMKNIGHALISPVKMYQFLKILYSFLKQIKQSK